MIQDECTFFPFGMNHLLYNSLGLLSFSFFFFFFNFLYIFLFYFILFFLFSFSMTTIPMAQRDKNSLSIIDINELMCTFKATQILLLWNCLYMILFKLVCQSVEHSFIRKCFYSFQKCIQIPSVRIKVRSRCKDWG